jgi:hypothetical protein
LAESPVPELGIEGEKARAGVPRNFAAPSPARVMKLKKILKQRVGWNPEFVSTLD